MKLDSHFVGTPLKPYQKTIHWRDTMNYAAAVDDPNDAYFDDMARGITALPIFPVAATWPMIERISEFIESFARRVGLPGIILQGTATLAFAVRELINHEAEARPQRVKAIYGRFTGMVRPGTAIRVMLNHKSSESDGIQLYFSVSNASGEKAIKDGCLSLAHSQQISEACADAL